MNRYYFKSFPEKGDIIYGTEEGSNRTHFFKVVESDESGALISPVYTRRIWENGEYGDAPDTELPFSTETSGFYFEKSKNGRFKVWADVCNPVSGSVRVFLRPYGGGVVPMPPVELCGRKYSLLELKKAVENMTPIQKLLLMYELLIALMDKAARNNEILDGFFEPNDGSYSEIPYDGVREFFDEIQEQQDSIRGFFSKIMEVNK